MADHQNPIKDTNKNKTLDGAELLSQMAAEEEQGGLRTPNEHVHGVLEEMGFRDLVAEWNRTLAEGAVSGGLNPQSYAKYKADVAKQLSTLIAKDADLFLKDEQKNPNLVKDRIAEIAADSALTPMAKTTSIADLVSLQEFAHHFHRDFPNGVNITPDQAAEVLGHFGKVMIPVGKMRETSDSLPKV